MPLSPFISLLFGVHTRKKLSLLMLLPPVSEKTETHVVWTADIIADCHVILRGEWRAPETLRIA